MRLLDTDVMIDILRGFKPALDWLAALGDEELGLPGYVVMELMDGCSNKTEMTRLQNSIQDFVLHWPKEADCNRALPDYARGHLSNNLGMLDAMIGQTAVGLGARLLTFNTKHFKAVTGLNTDQPYSKENHGAATPSGPADPKTNIQSL